MLIAQTMIVKAQETAESGFVSLQLSFLKIGNGSFEGIKVETQPGEVTELSLSRTRISEPIDYSGPNPIIFFREIPAPTLDDPNAVRREPLAQYLAPTTVKEGLLFFREKQPTSTEPWLYEVYGMDFSLKAFPEDSLVTVNSTNFKLIGRLGKEGVSINEGANSAISYKQFIKDQFPVGFALETADGPKILFEKNMEFTENYRIILVLAPPRREGSIRLQVYSIPDLLRTDSMASTGA